MRSGDWFGALAHRSELRLAPRSVPRYSDAVSTVQEIKAAIRSLSPDEREKLAEDLPELVEVVEYARWALSYMLTPARAVLLGHKIAYGPLADAIATAERILDETAWLDEEDDDAET